MSATPRHPVVDVLLERRAAGSKPGERSDGHRVALAIEGGSMRGVVSAGMTAALEQLGLLDAFDAVYGSSAGAINGAYFIARRSALCASSYYEEMTTRAFIDWRRYFSKDPVLSLDFVLDDVAEEEKPLDWRAVLRAPIEFHPIATSVYGLKAIDLGPTFDTKQELKDALRASAHVWLAAGPPLAYGDDLLIDASMFCSTPFAFALDGGATHVLALRTRPLGELRGRPTLVDRMFVARRLAKISPQLGAAFLERPERYRDEVYAMTKATAHPTTSPYLFAVAPREGGVRQAERDPARMRAGARAGVEAVYRAIAGEEPQVINVLRAYPRPS